MGFLYFPKNKEFRVLAIVGQFLIISVGLSLGAPLLIPIAVAFMLFLLFSPLVDRVAGEEKLLARWSASLGLMTFLTGVIFTSIYYLSGPSYAFFKSTVRDFKKIEKKIIPLKSSFKSFQKATEAVDDFASGSGPEGVAEKISQSGMGEELFNIIQTFLKDFSLVGFLLLFFLVYGDGLVRKSWKFMRPSLKITHSKNVLEKIKAATGRYLLTVTIINLCLGVAIGTSLYFVGMSNPILWGVLAMALNYIPYFGCMVGSALAGVVGLVTFDANLAALLPALVYFGINSLEGQIVTPLVLGNRFRVNPLVILLAMLYWGFLWGLVGLFVAVPFLVIAKLALDTEEPAVKKELSAA